MTASDNRELIERFYRAFQQRDGAAMAACYHANATFRDPVFELRGARIGAMWQMLCSRGADLRVEFTNVAGQDSTDGVDWQA
jgi:ketosteroid isomerase-like protein